jgi:hypothetical protein
LKLRNPFISGLLAVMALLALSLIVLGQTARTSRSSSDVTATAAHDLSGVWMGSRTAITISSQEPLLTPWADAKFKAAKPGYGPHATADSGDPILSCLPPGVPRIMLIPFPMQIVQTTGQIIMLFEYDHFVRVIYTDRKVHPKDLDATWMGDSIGKWDKDTFIVDTVGLKDQSWLDMVGHPHSDVLHVIERLRRVDHETLQDEITIDDPKAYKKPWSGTLAYKLRPSWHLIEYICEDNRAEPFK